MVKYRGLLIACDLPTTIVSCASGYGNLWRSVYKHYQMLLIEMKRSSTHDHALSDIATMGQLIRFSIPTAANNVFGESYPYMNSSHMTTH